jgi:MFS superfamily sulfate permease-like transporter
LAAIGVIIISKQVPFALGVAASGEPLHLLAQTPNEIMHLNPEIAFIGFGSLLILALYPLIRSRRLRNVPAPLVVLLFAVPTAMYFDLAHAHDYSFLGHHYTVNKSYLVNVPSDLSNAIVFPDFSVFANPNLVCKAIKWVVMFSLIGSLESLLSTKAIDLIDPKRRKTNLDRDLLAVGVANLASASIGGLPMISEIVRSRANIDNGAKSKFANMFHGIFLLMAIAFVAGAIRLVPVASLAAMLVYTGFRLAHPREFLHVYRIGREQFVVFVGTIVAVLATDLLIGILIGIGIELLIQFINGVPLGSLVRPITEVRQVDEKTYAICPQQSAVFCNWIMIRNKIRSYGLAQNMNIILDLSHASIVDHTVMEKLHEVERDFRAHYHPKSARMRGVVEPANDA